MIEHAVSRDGRRSRRCLPLGVAQRPSRHAAPQPARPRRTAARRSTRRPSSRSIAPRTALDIAQRVPGFTLDLGSNPDAIRARSTCAALPAPPAMSSSTAPGRAPRRRRSTSRSPRIPAQRVVRVEVGPGDLYGSDYAGKSQVLNIILSQQAGIDANVTAVGRSAGSPATSTPTSRARRSIRRGASTINLSGGTGRNRQLEEGTDTLTDVADRRARSSSAASSTAISTRTRIIVGQLGARARLGQGVSASTRAGSRARFDLFQSNRVTPTDGAAARRQSVPALSRSGDRAWRRRHPPARRRRDQVGRPRDAAQARRRRRLSSSATG